METGTSDTIAHSGLLLASRPTSPSSLLAGRNTAARIFFLLMTAMGLWLTYVGWLSWSTESVEESAGVNA